MPEPLDDVAVRVLGSLIEKELTAKLTSTGDYDVVAKTDNIELNAARSLGRRQSRRREVALDGQDVVAALAP